MALQAMIEVAGRAFADGMQTETLEHVLDSVACLKCEDLDLAARMASLSRDDRWCADEIHDEPGFHVSLFRVPAGHTLPLHDHPGMHVIFRTLWGRLRVEAFDWALEFPGSGLARLAYKRECDGGVAPILLEPHRGNLHRIEALEDCAFIDVLSPKYDPAQGRKCSYYREVETVERGDERLVRLELASE